MMMRTATSDRDVWFDSLHDLSQPLTVLGMALTLAQTSPNEAERSIALDAAVEECHRAMRSVRHMRQMLDGVPDGDVRLLGRREESPLSLLRPAGGARCSVGGGGAVGAEPLDAKRGPARPLGGVA